MTLLLPPDRGEDVEVGGAPNGTADDPGAAVDGEGAAASRKTKRKR